MGEVIKFQITRCYGRWALKALYFRPDSMGSLAIVDSFDSKIEAVNHLNAKYDTSVVLPCESEGDVWVSRNLTKGDWYNKEFVSLVNKLRGYGNSNVT